MEITLRINENINWSGWKEDPWESVEEASICISTSNTEGFALQQVCISSVEKFSDDICLPQKQESRKPFTIWAEYI